MNFLIGGFSGMLLNEQSAMYVNHSLFTNYSHDLLCNIRSAWRDKREISSYFIIENDMDSSNGAAPAAGTNIPSIRDSQGEWLSQGLIVIFGIYVHICI